MKTVITVLALSMLTGCASLSTHLRTGCVWSCADAAHTVVTSTVVSSGTTVNTGITAHTYHLPSASYLVIRSGSTTSVIQTSRSR